MSSAFLSSKQIRVNVTQVDALHNLQAVARHARTYREPHTKCGSYIAIWIVLITLLITH